MTPEQFSENLQRPPETQTLQFNRVLFLTQDLQLVRDQLDGRQIQAPISDLLMDGVSTDEIIPNKICLQYTGNEPGLLGEHFLTGLRGGIVKPGEIKNGGFDVLAAGQSFARGSSRYHAPLAIAEAGIKAIIGKPERIFAENAVNAGIHIVPPDGDLAQRMLTGEPITIDDLQHYLSPVSKDIMSAGSLMQYFRHLEEGAFSYPAPDQTKRPMTMVEKMIARKTYTSNSNVGVEYVRPGEEVIAQPDRYYGYELQTTVGRKVLEKDLGEDFIVRNPEKALFFNDHTALIQHTQAAQIQQQEQKKFAQKHGIVNFENDTESGAPAICHTKMIEDYALPGELILGNDSHTCTVGVLDSLAIGKGAADLSGALAFDKMVIKVPETIRINLSGKLGNGATMKDLMLHLGALPKLKQEGIGSNRVLEFGGESLDSIPLDEQLKLTNMAIELQAFTGVIEPNVQIVKYLQQHRGLDAEEILEMMVASDEDAEYFDTIAIDLSIVEPTVATPGDTQNGIPLSEIARQNIVIHKAYIGSCTHGTPEDLRQAADAIRGHTVAEGVKLFVQASSKGNLHSAEEEGYIQTLLDAGAELLPIGCGACMNAGPGSTEQGEVGIFATNRNFPGRTGKGETYLANPAVVAASAVKGAICGPEALQKD